MILFCGTQRGLSREAHQEAHPEVHSEIYFSSHQSPLPKSRPDSSEFPIVHRPFTDPSPIAHRSFSIVHAIRHVASKVCNPPDTSFSVFCFRHFSTFFWEDFQRFSSEDHHPRHQPRVNGRWNGYGRAEAIVVRIPPLLNHFWSTT